MIAFWKAFWAILTRGVNTVDNVLIIAEANTSEFKETALAEQQLNTIRLAKLLEEAKSS